MPSLSAATFRTVRSCGCFGTRLASEGARIGGRPDDYHRKVQAAFHIIAAEEPERVKLVDASGTPVEVTERLLHAIEDLFA